jgi:N-acetylglucosaminyl-diphospho-decaprenol L-rhamnosyltransferase
VSGQPSPAVTVTIVLYNSEPLLTRCLEALRPELDSGVAELVAVDNASPDDSSAVLTREARLAKLIRAERNLGFAGGANLGWPSAEGRYWMLLNPDVELQAGGLRALTEWMDARPRVGVASAEIDHGPGEARSAGRALPAAWRPLLEASRLHLLLPRTLRGRIFRGAYWRGGDQLTAGWVPGTAMIARREAVEQVGLLDERFFLYGEDIEWCWRMRRAGWRVGVCSTVVARHEEGSSAKRTFEQPEIRRRMVEGEVNAVRAVRGELAAKLYARATALALTIEANHPRRDPKRRRAARQGAALWKAASRRIE